MFKGRKRRPAIRPFVVSVLAAAHAIVFAGGCESPQPTATPAPAPLRVAAASDLQAALPAVIEAFTARTGIAVSPTFGASGQLAEQIKQGAPFDVFLAANRAFVDDLASVGVVRPDSVHPYARGSLVLAVHRASGESIQTLNDLVKPEVKKVALANPAFAPYGAAGKQALERAGLWPAVAPKIVQAESVRQALQFVQSGNAEAGLVGRALADVPEVRVVALDPGLYEPIVQALGIIARARRTDDAAAFAEFVRGAEGRAILVRSGFLTPEPTP